jgi:hypothetical protein
MKSRERIREKIVESKKKSGYWYIDRTKDKRETTKEKQQKKNDKRETRK